MVVTMVLAHRLEFHLQSAGSVAPAVRVTFLIVLMMAVCLHIVEAMVLLVVVLILLELNVNNFDF